MATPEGPPFVSRLMTHNSDAAPFEMTLFLC